MISPVSSPVNKCTLLISIWPRSWLFCHDILVLFVLEFGHVGNILHVLQLGGALSAAEVEATATTAAAPAAASGETEYAEHEALDPRAGELHNGAHHLVSHLWSNHRTSNLCNPKLNGKCMM